MKADKLLRAAADKIVERGQAYGDMNDTYSRAAVIANSILGTHLGVYDVLMVLHAAKLARMAGPTDQTDNYLDGVNYLAFANEARKTSIEQEMVEGVEEIARKFAPRNTTGEEPIELKYSGEWSNDPRP